MKRELLKILLWLLITFITVFIYYLFISFLYPDWIDLVSFLKSFINDPIKIALLFVPYLLFKVVSILVYLFNKIFRYKINYNKLALIIIFTLSSIFLINIILVEYILYSYYTKNYNFHSEYSNTIIDSTNYQSSHWFRNIIDYHGYYLMNQELVFINDSTISISTYAYNIPENTFSSDLFYKYVFKHYDKKFKYYYKTKDNYIVFPDNKFLIKFANGKVETDFDY